MVSELRPEGVRLSERGRTVAQRGHDSSQAGIERIAIIVDADDVDVKHPGRPPRLNPEACERKHTRTEREGSDRQSIKRAYTEGDDGPTAKGYG